MTPLQSTTRCAHVLREAPGQRSRENATVLLDDLPLEGGTVLGRVSTTGKYTRWTGAGTDGSQIAAAVLYYPLPAGIGENKAVVHARDCVFDVGALHGVNETARTDLAELGMKTVGREAVRGWLLATGAWSDGGKWVDQSTWNDGV